MPSRMPLVSALTVLALWFTRPVLAASGAEDVVFGEHPEYYVCEKTEDCVAVKTLCEEWRAINKRHEAKLADAVNFLSVAFVCKEQAPYQSQPGVTCTFDRTCQLGK